VRVIPIRNPKPETRNPPFIPISRPLIGREERAAVLAVLRSGQLAQGEQVERLEQRFATLCGARYAVATSSGTTALQTALLAHGVGRDDEVITSSFTFVATANAILAVGARPVFADIEGDTFNLDPGRVAARITPRTRALLPVHLYGHPADLDALGDLARRHALPLIEDACQAVSATYRSQPVGSFGTGCFSLYATKNVMSGEGGMLTTNDPDIADKARMIRNFGMRERYYHESLGFNFKMSEIEAAIALCQIDRLEAWTSRRQANAAYLTQRLRGVTPPPIRGPVEHVFHQYTIRVAADQRDTLVERLHRNGVGANIYYRIPVHQQPFYRGLGYNDSLPIAEAASQEVISLPVHPGLSPRDLHRIVQAVNRRP